MRHSTWYSMPDRATVQLEDLVTRIEARPGPMIRAGEFDELRERIRTRAALTTLPAELTDDDLAGILWLSLLTECATETYAKIFEVASIRYGEPWLGRFMRNVWVPDELTHADPYRLMLLDLGYSEAELDRQVNETRQRAFPFPSGETPFHLTVYGMLQEYLTDNWHGLIAKLLRRGCPEAAWMAARIKQRETMHTLWYRDMSVLQLEANPSLLGHVVEVLLSFKMPGNALAPSLQAKAPVWLPNMGADYERIRRDLIRLVHSVTADTRQTGMLLLRFAAERGDRLGPVSVRHIEAAVGLLGSPGQGLVGEALLERVGLGYLFLNGRQRAEDGGIVGRLRGLLRAWIADRIDLEFRPYAG